jgi:hypothetical protein
LAHNSANLILEARHASIALAAPLKLKLVYFLVVAGILVNATCSRLYHVQSSLATPLLQTLARLQFRKGLQSFQPPFYHERQWHSQWFLDQLAYVEPFTFAPRQPTTSIVNATNTFLGNGKYLGGTISLPVTSGLILVATLALFVQASGGFF